MVTLKEEGQKIAKELNLRYEGVQEEIGMQFTDIHGTGTTFYATSIEDARKQLREKRKLFGMAEGGNPEREILDLDYVGREWEKLTKLQRQPIVERANLPSSFALRDWEQLPLSKKDAIRMNFPKPPAVGGNPDMPRFSEAVPEVIPKGKFVRVTIKAEGKRQRSFWAIKDVETPIGNIYVPVDKEGAPSIRYEKDVAIETKDLIARAFIIKEQIAHLDRTYGILKLGRLEPPTAEELGRPPAVGGNPVRVRFDRASIDSAIAAAKRLESEKDLYIFATHLGYTIDSRPPPGVQQYVVVHPDGTTETVKPSGSMSNPSSGDKPMKKLITREEAIGMLERLSATPQEAARLLVVDEEERQVIWRGVQERVKREQHKFAPFDPREGPPLPRIFGGLRWPWRKT